MQGGVLAPDLVYAPYVVLYVAGPVPVPDLVLVDLGVLVVDGGAGFAAGGVLDQLVAVVDAVGRGERSGERETHLECGASAELEDVRQDVVGVGEEVRAHVLARLLLRELSEVLDDLRLLVAPGEVRVGLVKADLSQALHDARPGERFGQEDHVGVRFPNFGDQPLPESERLGVRVVHPECPHPLLDPEQHHVEPLLPEVLPILRFPVHVHDVLVLLRRVLGVLYGAVGAEFEPFGMLFYVRVVRGTLNREVQRHLHPVLLARLQEMPEVLQRTELRVDGFVAALFAPDGVGTAGVVGGGGEGVVFALAVLFADRMNGEQVDHIEPHPRYLGQPLLRLPEGRVPRPGSVPWERWNISYQAP